MDAPDLVGATPIAEVSAAPVDCVVLGWARLPRLAVDTGGVADEVRARVLDFFPASGAQSDRAPMARCEGLRGKTIYAGACIYCIDLREQ